MSVQRIASRYAKSLIELADEMNKLDKVREDITSFKKAVQNKDLYNLFQNPVINSDKKVKIVDKIFEGKYDELTMKFLRILINKGREAYLPEIAAEFFEQFKRAKHISTVKLESAKKLSEAEIKEIKDKLVASSLTDDSVELEVIVNPELIGGFLVAFDDKIYDASIKNKLNLLRKDYNENLYVSQIFAE